MKSKQLGSIFGVLAVLAGLVAGDLLATWRQWWIDWDAKAGDYIIAVRATDGEGNVQPEPYVAIEPNGAEGWHSRNVRVS